MFDDVSDPRRTRTTCVGHPGGRPQIDSESFRISRLIGSNTECGTAISLDRDGSPEYVGRNSVDHLSGMAPLQSAHAHEKEAWLCGLLQSPVPVSTMAYWKERPLTCQNGDIGHLPVDRVGQGEQESRSHFRHGDAGSPDTA